MSDKRLVKTRIKGGIWEGVLTCDSPEPPELAVTLLGSPVTAVAVDALPEQPGRFSVKIAIPPDCLADGVQTFVIADADSGETLNSFAIITGEPIEDDIRAEIDLLRQELDLLKRAFRRHCAETA